MEKGEGLLGVGEGRREEGQPVVNYSLLRVGYWGPPFSFQTDQNENTFSISLFFSFPIHILFKNSSLFHYMQMKTSSGYKPIKLDINFNSLSCHKLPYLYPKFELSIYIHPHSPFNFFLYSTFFFFSSLQFRFPTKKNTFISTLSNSIDTIFKLYSNNKS